MEEVYRAQVMLLLQVLPEIAKEDSFALHGGTAINLFVRDMPRLSVDIDLTYVHIEDRRHTLENINHALLRIKAQVEALKAGAQILHQVDKCKLQISQAGVQIKVEVNMVGRGAWGALQKRQLCNNAQEEFDAFCAITAVSLGQLYGGKICAALDRQHPRDLFDVKLLMENEGFSEEIKSGFLLSLASSPRPIHEILNPNFQDQRQAFENQFEGMTNTPFTYAEYEKTRSDLISTVKQSITERDRDFLVSVNSAEPDWSTHDFERFPAVQWKLQNVNLFKTNSPGKYSEQCEALKRVLG